MSKTNETRHIKWHETCKCKCWLDASVCKVDANNKVDANVKSWLIKVYATKDMLWMW